MPTDLDFGLYFNLAFLSILGLGILFGFLRGFKKSLWSFLITAIFMAFFFLTIDMVVNVLWTMNMPFLGGLLANVSSDLSGVSNLAESLPILLGQFLPEDFASTVTNANFLEFTTSIALFAVKLVYTVLYFTVIQVLYRLILWIIRMIISPSKKKTDKYKSKNRVLGSVFGLLQGCISLYITLIIFGGVMSIAESVSSIMPDPNPPTVRQIEYRDEFRSPNASVVEMAAIALPDIGGLDEATEMLEGMIEGYNTNIVVTYQDMITMTSPYNPDEQMPLNLYLFDSVLSMDYQEEQIAIRAELDVLTNVLGNVLNSDFYESQDLGDLTGDDIRGIFIDLSESNIITTILPLGVEVAAEAFDVDLDIPVDELYAIEWDVELMQLGEIAATGMDIVNAAGVFNGSLDLTTVTLDGDDIEGLFDALGDSELITLAAYVAIEPVLEMAGDDIQAFVTVPADLDWSAEFQAIGALAGEVLNAGLTVGAVESGDIGTILPLLANIDFTILLDSKIITNAMINILSGETSIDISEFITVPSGIQWLNEEVGGVTVYGELYNILQAINALSASASDLDFTSFENLSLNTIAQFTADDINALFKSKILIATVTSYLDDLELGEEFPIIMPDSVFDVDGYILKTELENVVNAVFMLVNELACPLDKTACQELGVDIDAIFTLEADDIDTLLLSDVLSASAGSLIVDLGGDMLTVPGSAMTEIFVDEVATDIVSSAEIKAAFLAISALGISGIDNLEIDPSILSNLALEGQPTVLDTAKSDLLFGSVILNATLSSYLIDFATGAEAMVVVPYYAEDDLTVIRVVDPVDDTEYISQTELTNVLKAVLVLDITDFTAVDQLDIGNLIDNVDILLDSSILHATVSKQLLDLTELVVVPLNDSAGEPLKITVGTGEESSIYIAQEELEAAFDALSVLEINDINNIAIDLSILENLAVDGEPTVLDTDKSDILFSSSIINATLAKYLLDFTEGAEAVVVVPFEDQDGFDIRTIDAADGTEYITELELTNILKAVLVLDIQDFNAVDTIDISDILDNVSTLLDSAILHATVSKQLLDMTEVIVVPTNNELGNPVKVITGPVGDETTFIEKDELEAAFDALSVLNITDINDVAIDISILNNLAVEGEPTVLDTDKSDRLFASAVINATLSKYLIDFTAGDDPFIVVPYIAEDDTVIRVVDPVDGVEIIAEVELTNILEAVLILDIQDFNAVDTLSLAVIIDNMGALLDSSILQASVSKQLTGLTEVVVVPTNNELGVPVKVTTGDPGFETDFIARVELEATFAALEVLEITDIEAIAIDMTILDNLAEEGNPTILDTDKADILFSSAVINATLSKYILDFSEGDDPFLVVPVNAEDDTVITVTDPVDSVQVITEIELTNVLEAILILDLESFDSVENLALDSILNNVSAILDSSIMHASISKQFIDLGEGTVVVPTHHQNDDELIVTKGAVVFINRDELENTFDALEVLGMNDIANMTVDITSILDNLGEDGDPTVLDTDKSDIIFSSTILTATISKYIIDFSEGDSPILYVPQRDESNAYVRTVSAMDGTNFVSEVELTNILSAILALGLSDFDNVSTLTLETIIANKTAILASTILQATVSQQLIDLSGTTVLIPEFEEDNLTEVLITRGDAGEEMTYIASVELNELFDALDVLGVGDLDGFDGGVDLTVLDEPGAVHTLVQSAILQATISDQVLDLAGGTGATLVVIPYETPDGLVSLRRTIGVTEQVEMIKQSELENLIIAFVELGFTDVDNMESAISISTLTDNAATIFESYVIQATVSQQVLDLESPTVIIPYYSDNLLTPTRLRNVSGLLALETTEYIDKTELINLMAALDVLIPEGEGVSGFDGSVDLSLFYDLGPRTILINSYILQATISKQIIDLGTAIEVPTYRDDSTVVKLTAGTLLAEQNDYLVDDEIHALFEALEVLGMAEINEFNSDALNFDKFMPSFGPGYVDNQNALLASACIQATVSSQIIDLRVSGSVVIPTNDAADAVVSLTVPGTEYILVSEIKHLFNALDVLGFSVTDFGGDLGLNALFESSNPTTYNASQDTMLESAIMHATMTDQISVLDGAAVVIPLTDIGGVSIENIVTNYTFLKKTEIKALINGMDLLGFTGSLSGFDGDVDLTTLSDSGNQDTVLLSVILHATLSDQIITLDGGAIIIPTTDFAGISIRKEESGTDFIEKLEIKSLLDAMNVLGIIGNLSTFDGNIGLNSLLESSEPIDYTLNQTTVLASAIMHRTITDQIVGMSTGTPVIVLPDTNIGGTDIDATVSTNYFILEGEIKALINAMDVLGVGGTLSGFDGDMDLTQLADNTAQNTLLLSAIMHATLSDKLINTTLDIPDDDINRTVQIRVSQSGTEFIENTEMKALLVSLDMLGLTNFGSMGLVIGDIYGKDMSILLASATIQATMSGEILPQAAIYSAASSGDFIIPAALRETITIDSVSAKWIERAELIELIEAFNTMGLTGFNVSVNASSFGSYNQTQIHAILESGSMHLTIEKMIMSNGSLNSYIPDVDGEVVIVDSLYSLTNVINVTEVENFILAINKLGGDISGDIDAVAVAALGEGDRNIVLSSYITRCRLTAELQTLYWNNHASLYGASDYETLSSGVVAPICLTYVAAQNAF